MIQQMLHRDQLPTAFLVTCAAGGIGLALTFLAFPAVYMRTPSFRYTFNPVQPWTWAFVMCSLGVLIIAAAYMNQRAAFWPCLLLAVAYSALGLSITPTIVEGKGVPSGIVVYSVVGVLTVLSGILARVWPTLHRVDP